MDFIEGLPKSHGFSVILVVVDRYTKYTHFLPLKHPYTTAHVARLYLDSVVKLHSLPLSIVSDRDNVFTSAFWQSLFKGMHTQLNLSTVYHPQSDGQIERVNQCLEMFLRCSVSASPTKWADWLPLAKTGTT
jgi:transposase InsO family protein